MRVLLLFFCSGATALVYEVLWSRYLTLMLGSTVQAQTVVLAVFMGGLALGNRLFGAHAARVRGPLKSYAMIELVIGAYAFLFPELFRLADAAFVSIGSAVVDTPVVPLFLKFLLSVFLLLLPTVLMGGTLPLLAEWIERQQGLEQSVRVGIFYAVNSLGAVLGAGLAGFYLVQTFGLSSSLQLTGIVNILIGFIALVLARREVPKPATRVEPTEEFTAQGRASGAWFGALVALTGGVSMGLEVLSARALVLMVGGSIQAFALVLMSFILGIGLGSVAISSSRAARRFEMNLLYFLLTGAAALVLIHVLAIEQWTMIYSRGRVGLASNIEGYIWHQLAVGLLAFLFLGLPAALLGAVVPLAIRLAETPCAALGEKVGRLLTWNTLGAVTGVLLTGFILMPAFGLRAALATLAILLIAAAGFIAHQRQHSAVLIFCVLFGAGAMVAVTSTGEKWRHVMSAGLFRIRNSGVVTPKSIAERKARLEIVFYKDSPDATVCVEKGVVTNNTYQLTLRINGKSDASTLGDVATQYLLAHIPMAARPDATNAFVLGFGSGITAGALLGHPIQSLTIAENCEPVLEAGPLFDHWNRGVLTNSRTRVINDDARSVLKLHPDKYDVIISEPSNPWVVGIGSVFSEDFYRLCASRLTDGGVMAQWFHKYEMSDHIVFLIFRTFAAVFPHMEVWDTQEGDLILLGSEKAWPSNPGRYQAIFDRAQPAKDLAALRIKTPVQLWARQVASQKTASVIAGDGPRQTDDTPLLEYAAPKAFFMGAQADRMYLFDERSLQFLLADRTKIETMRALPDRELIDTFLLFGPSNPDIRLYLDAIATSTGVSTSDIDALFVKSPDGAAKAPVRRATRLDPMGHIIFRKPDSYPGTAPRSANAGSELVECLAAEAGILRDEQRWPQYAQHIEQTLLRLIASSKLRPAEFAPEYFAGLVARTAIGHGDYRHALHALRLGFIFAKEDDQLQFLSRVVDHIAPPELLDQRNQNDGALR